MRERRKILANDDNHSQEPNLAAVFDQHIKHEFEDHDVEATMETMTKEPYVHHVPMMTGGIGYAGVYNFYKNHFIGKMPDDTKVVRISRTVGKDQDVEIKCGFGMSLEDMQYHYIPLLEAGQG